MNYSQDEVENILARLEGEREIAVTVLRSKINYLYGYTDARPEWVERTPYRTRLFELVEDLLETLDRVFPERR